MRENEVCKTKPKQIVAYFDFDGTLTTRDTLLPFLIFCAGYLRFLYKLPVLAPIVLCYWLKIINNETAKEKALSALLKGKSLAELDKKARLFVRKKLSYYIKPEIYTKVEYHVEHGHTIIIISANLALYLNHWAKRHKLDGVIGTELEFIDGVFTGKLKTRNCYGKQKVLRISEYVEKLTDKTHYSYGYGNSRGDYALLFYVNEGYWISGTDIISWADYRANKRK